MIPRPSNLMSKFADTPIAVLDLMTVDEFQRDPLRDLDDMYLSDSDIEFTDAVSEMPVPADEHSKNGTIHAELERSSSLGPFGQPSGLEPSQQMQPLESAPHGIGCGLASQYDGDPNSTDGQPTGGDSLNRKRSLDLAENIQGLYRILDLIPEQGSGGLG